MSIMVTSQEPVEIRIVDPLTEKFRLGDLPRYAPWIAEQIELVGTPEIGAVLQNWGYDLAEPQLMTTWVSALKSCHSELWQVTSI